jgi:AcrR family transcriptional regulator
VFAENADASMDDIARAAGVSRQTVYSHFSSRGDLLEGLLAEVTDRVVRAIADADLDTGPAVDALLRFLDSGWQAFEGDPFLLHVVTPPRTAQEELDQHQPVLGPLESLIRRGQSTGEFDRALPVGWILAATMGLGHAAGEEVRAGRMSSQQAIDALRRTIRRVVAAQDASGP